MSLPDEELLSAYLDGELSADERSRVERLLAESPDNRQLLEELRSIQTSLQRMPRARLGHDFADQVLRQAERELLTAGADADTLQENVESGGEKRAVVFPSGRIETSPEHRLVSWQRLRRPVIWASLTLAAGLLVMFLDRDRMAGPGRQVAMVGGDKQEDELKPSAAAKSASRDAPDGSVRDNLGRRNTEGPEIGAAATTALHDLPERPSPLAEQPESRTGRPGRSESMREHYTPPPPAASPAMASDNGPPPPREAGHAAGKPARADYDTEAGRGLAEGEKRDDRAAGMADDVAAAPNTLIVWCDVAEGTKYSESFRALLAQQNIRWEDEGWQVEKEALPLDITAKTAGAEAAAKAKLFAENDTRLSKQIRQLRLAEAEQALLDSVNEVVLVEAGQPQIEAVLAAIDGDTSVFVTVDVEPAPDAPQPQRQLQRFARGQVASEELAQGLQETTRESKKREEVPLVRGVEPASPEADEKQAAAGFARRLLGARSAAPPDDTAKDTVQKQERPQFAKPQAKNEEDVPTTKSIDAYAFGLGGRSGQAADKGRFHVVFVLHPVDSSTPAAAMPSGTKSSEAKPSKAEPSKSDD